MTDAFFCSSVVSSLYVAYYIHPTVTRAHGRSLSLRPQSVLQNVQQLKPHPTGRSAGQGALENLPVISMGEGGGGCNVVCLLRTFRLSPGKKKRKKLTTSALHSGDV